MVVACLVANAAQTDAPRRGGTGWTRQHDGSPSPVLGRTTWTEWHQSPRTVTNFKTGVGARADRRVRKRWAGCKVRIVPAGKLIHVYYGKILLRSVAFEPGQRYHGQGRVRKEVVSAR